MLSCLYSQSMFNTITNCIKMICHMLLYRNIKYHWIQEALKSQQLPTVSMSTGLIHTHIQTISALSTCDFLWAKWASEQLKSNTALVLMRSHCSCFASRHFLEILVWLHSSSPFFMICVTVYQLSFSFTKNAYSVGNASADMQKKTLYILLSATLLSLLPHVIFLKSCDSIKTN